MIDRDCFNEVKSCNSDQYNVGIWQQSLTCVCKMNVHLNVQESKLTKIVFKTYLSLVH